MRHWLIPGKSAGAAHGAGDAAAARNGAVAKLEERVAVRPAGTVALGENVNPAVVVFTYAETVQVPAFPFGIGLLMLTDAPRTG